MPVLDVLAKKALHICDKEGLVKEKVRIKARPLSPKEAIGNPEADDFPLQRGKERLMQAEFRGTFGQAFTDRYGDFEGTVGEIFEMPLNNNYRRAIFVASLNALLRHSGHIDRTIHCRDKEPALCAARLRDHITSRYGRVNIAQVGFQPRMVETLGAVFDLRVIDLDPDNIGFTRFNIIVEGPDATEDLIRWADLLVVTGTTVVNATIDHFMGNKPIIFYGTTIAGPAYLMGWERFCACSR